MRGLDTRSGHSSEASDKTDPVIARVLDAPAKRLKL